MLPRSLQPYPVHFGELPFSDQLEEFYPADPTLLHEVLHFLPALLSRGGQFAFELRDAFEVLDAGEDQTARVGGRVPTVFLLHEWEDSHWIGRHW